MATEAEAHKAAIELAKSHLSEIKKSCDNLIKDLQTRLDLLREKYLNIDNKSYTNIQLMIDQFKDMINKGIENDNITYVEQAWCGGNKNFYNGIKNNIEELENKIKKSLFRKKIAISVLIAVIFMLIILLIGYFVWQSLFEQYVDSLFIKNIF